ncbi:hypothetical protein Lal_00020100 [Lupinus albus]|uniref:Uncharacterized protein n=1 Tax=Lupinus albus TaxID=3870 RepID=A0A6A5MFQ8_LUPAL|nr:hypothetical protein Lalb_Chr08g0239091 [Lupinus albus]KAF1871308.1 hypothetical protein Lal_00020100 [Lupinus albus]
MGRRGFEPRSVFIIVALFMSLLCIEIGATSRLRSKEDCTLSGIACHVKGTRLHEALEIKDYGEGEGDGDGSPPHSDYDYDFYRKHGDIPSPGAGH